MVDITPAAAAEIKRIKLNRNRQENGSLKLKVVSGGCSGLFYDLRFESTPKEQHSASLDEQILEIKGIDITIDPKAWQYLEHLKLDYSEDLMGGGFRFHNPQLEGVCGCGISFSKLK